MPIFLLIRHGETDYNKKMHLPGRFPGVHLNQKGRRQAQLLADNLGECTHQSHLFQPVGTDFGNRWTARQGLEVWISSQHLAYWRRIAVIGRVNR